MYEMKRDLAQGFDELGLEVPFAEKLGAEETRDVEIALREFGETPFAAAYEAEPTNDEWLEDDHEAGEPEGLVQFAERLGKEWSKGRGGQPSPEAIRDWLLKDYQDTLDGARRRWKNKFGSGGLDAKTITQAWMISRQDQMRFTTASASNLKPLRNFTPPSQSVALVADPRIHDSKKAPVAQIMVQFVKELRRRFGGSLSVSNYRGHGGGKFRDRGYSLDLFLKGRDQRGFYPPQDSMALLRAVNEAASAVQAQWRVIYNDFEVADAINRETGQINVIFAGTVRRDTNKRITGLNWHGPAPLILHFHLDLSPLPVATEVSEFSVREESQQAVTNMPEWQLDEADEVFSSDEVASEAGKRWDSEGLAWLDLEAQGAEAEWPEPSIAEAEWSEGEDLDAGWSEAVSSEDPEGEELETHEEFDALEDSNGGETQQSEGPAYEAAEDEWLEMKDEEAGSEEELETHEEFDALEDSNGGETQQSELGLGKDRTGFAGTVEFGRATDRTGFSDALITPPDHERETQETPQAANCRKKWEAFIGSLTEEVRTALAANDFDLAVITAIHSGLRDIKKLTDMLFFSSWGRTRGYCRISLNERDPAGKKMADWWIELRQKHVVPAVKQPSPKLPQAGGIVCIERGAVGVRRADAAPEAPTIDLTGTYEQQRPGKAPHEVVRINQAGTHIECLFRRVSKPSDTAPGQTAFLFGDRQEDGSYYLFSARNPRALVLLKPAGSDILLMAGSGQSTLQLMNDDAAHLLPTLGNYADELVRLHEQRPISHAQSKHLVEGLAPKKIEPYLTDYFRQSPDDLAAAKGARRKSGDRFDLYLKSVFRHPEFGFLNIDKQDVQLVSFYARSLLSEAKWKNGDIMSHLDWIQRMQSRMVRDHSSLIYAEEWLGLRRLPPDNEPKHRYKVEVNLKGGGLWIHGYTGTITFEKISDDTPKTRWKKGERHSYGCRIVGGQAGASLGFQQTGEAVTDYEWQPRDIPGPIRVGQFGVSATYGPASAGATGGFIHVEGSRQFPLMHVTFKKFDFDVDPKKLKKKRRGKPTAKSLKIGPGGFFGSIRPKTFPPQDLSTPPEQNDYAVALSLREDVHFCLNSALLTEDARQALRIMIAKELPAFESPLSRIEITGHTDRSVPPRLKPAEQVRYNQVLSELRAQNTWKAIEDILGSGLAILPDRDHRVIVGQGDSLAAKAGQRPGKKNAAYRRVDIVLNARLILTLGGGRVST